MKKCRHAKGFYGLSQNVWRCNEKMDTLIRQLRQHSRVQTRFRNQRASYSLPFGGLLRMMLIVFSGESLPTKTSDCARMLSEFLWRELDLVSSMLRLPGNRPMPWGRPVPMLFLGGS